MFLACLGQLRLAPSGHAIGIDMTAALGIAEARGCDLAVASELLQAVETGLIESMNEQEARVSRNVDPVDRRKPAQPEGTTRIKKRDAD